MISILLATYNGERYIEQSIISILNQTFTEFELLVGFNGTTDNSKKLVASFQDSRIRVFDYGEDKGKAVTLNKLLKQVRYDWIAIQDDDDIWVENKLERQIPYIKTNDVVGTLASYIDEHNNVFYNLPLVEFDQDIKSNFKKGTNQIVNSSSLFKTADALAIGGWDPAMYHEDFDMWLRLYNAGKIFYNVQELLVYHRIHPDSNFNAKPATVSIAELLQKNKI